MVRLLQTLRRPLGKFIYPFITLGQVMLFRLSFAYQIVSGDTGLCLALDRISDHSMV